MFVYSFVTKFIESTKDKVQIEGLDNPMECVRVQQGCCWWLIRVAVAAASLENALLSSQPEPVLEQILSRFVKNLRPKKGSGPYVPLCAVYRVC